MARKSTEIKYTDAVRNLQLVQPRLSRTKSSAALYAFYIYDVTINEVVRSFGFDIPPQSMQLGEQAAAEAVPLQEGRYWIDERGQYFKNVQLSGTFGFRPNRILEAEQKDWLGLKQSKEQIQRALAAFQSPKLPTIPKKERTGMDRYVELHNMIRFYWDQKGVRDRAAKYIFVYANWKMGEVYICQPLAFNRMRQAPSDRFKVRWTLQLRLLEPWNQLAVPEDLLQAPKSPTGFAAALKWIRDAARVLDAVNQSIQRTVDRALDLGTDIVGSILAVGDEVVNLVRTFPQAFYKIGTFPAQVMRQAFRVCLNAAGVFDDFKKLGDIGRPYKNAARLYAQLFGDIAALWENLPTTAPGIQLEDAYERKSGGDKVVVGTGDREKVSRPAYTPRKKLASIYQRPEAGVQAVALPRGVTIKELAKLKLGDVTRWRELVYINGLKPPYISENGDGKTVLRPGVDHIKIPIIPDTVEENKISSTVEDVVPREVLLYGRDLRVDLDSGDLLVDAQGDLALVEGFDNLVQASVMRVRHKPGSLAAHSWYGLDLEAGTGVELDTLAKVHLQIDRTFSADPRIERLDNLTVHLYGDVAQIKCTIVPKDSDNNIGVSTVVYR